MKKVVLLEGLGISEKEMAEHKEKFKDSVEFAEYVRCDDTATLIKEAEDADALIIANMPLKGEVIEACKKLQFIDVAFTGVDHVDLKTSKEKGVVVSNASGYSTEAVSELAVGMAINLLRNIRLNDLKTRTGQTGKGLGGFELKGKTAGIIGYGKIGSRTGELLKTFGCNILAHSRHHHDDYPEYVKQVSLDELLKESDIVILHCPLNDSTRGMINYEKLCLMKRNAILVNVARGPVTVEEDLALALKEGIIAGAAVDVFSKEPPLDENMSLLKAPNTLFTPHIGFASAEAMSFRAEIVFDNLRAWLNGNPQNLV